MRTILTRVLALSGIVLLIATGCKKTDALVVTNGGQAGTLTATTVTPSLAKANLGDTATKVITFSFTKANYGYSAAITNTLQIDKASDNWKSPVSVTLSNNVLTQGYNTINFDKLLLSLNMVAGTSAPVQVRVAQSVSSGVTTYSNVLTVTATPFNLTSWLYITGQFSNWNNPGAGEDSLLSPTGNGVYQGIINFPAGNNQFLVLPAKNWNNKYATNDSSTPSANIVYNGSNNFNAPAAAGQYLITVNLNTNTISFQLADYYSVIGSAPPGTAWSNDYAMKYINDGSGAWVAQGIPMVVGEYKFRQDNQWTQSWGPSATAGTVVNANATGDGNIQLTVAGTYNLSFIGNATPYGTAIGSGAGQNNIATTTYTAVKTN